MRGDDGNAGYVGIKFECADLVGNAATSVYYSLWIQGSGPLLYGFVPTPSVWVSAAASANMTVTVRGKEKESAKKEAERWRSSAERDISEVPDIEEQRDELGGVAGRGVSEREHVPDRGAWGRSEQGAVHRGRHRGEHGEPDEQRERGQRGASVQRVRADSVGEVEHCGERDDHGHAVWDGDSDGEVRADDRREQLWGVGGSGVILCEWSCDDIRGASRCGEEGERRGRGEGEGEERGERDEERDGTQGTLASSLSARTWWGTRRRRCSYSLWIQGSGPLLYGFVPTPSVWVSAAASANMTVTVRGKGERVGEEGSRTLEELPLSVTSVRYRISRNSGTSWEAWLDVASVSGSTFRTGALGAGANRVQFIAADIVANMANLTSSVSVDSVAPVYSGFGPTVWVKSNTVANVTITDTQSGTVTGR